MSAGSLQLMLQFTMLLLLASPWHVQGGQEVVKPFDREDLWTLKPSEIALVQYDSRPMGGFWNVSARWNAAYARQHGHMYSYWSSSAPCHYRQSPISPSWCKIKAMLDADSSQKLSRAKAFLFMDSDAVVTSSYSMSAILTYIQQYLHWNWSERPVAFNQDGPGYACRMALQLGYGVCLNSGTVFWMRSPIASRVLRSWWSFAGAPLNSTRFPMNWRVKWPWEQAPQYEVLEKFARNVLLLSFPHFAVLPWGSRGKPTFSYPDSTVEPWCFSHWRGAGCFITHFCASKNQKKALLTEYSALLDEVSPSPFEVEQLSLPRLTAHADLPLPTADQEREGEGE